MRWFWLSFCDAEKPKGEQFLGACIASGEDGVDAVRNAHRHGCNPGGEVMIVGAPEVVVIDESDAWKLMDRAHAESWKPSSDAKGTP